MRTVYIDPQGSTHYRKPHHWVIDGKHWYGVPTNQQLILAGWQIKEIIDPIPEPYIPTIRELVQMKMRERYPMPDDELAIINNHLMYPDNEQYTADYEEYKLYREEAKEWAKQQPHREEN